MNPQLGRALCAIFILAACFTSRSGGQVLVFPYTQGFDSVPTPSLPAGWSSSQNRTPGTNDFTTSTSTPQSPPNNVVSTNATISQALYSPLFDFRDHTPNRLGFFTRRTATHLARVVVEASTDSGATFPIQLGDSLTNAGQNNYVPYSIPLPALLANRNSVQFRWRVVADVGGTQGTFRIDDITVTVQTSHDLTPVALRFSPTTPIELDSVRAFILVRNVGLQSASTFQVDIYDDLNNDSLPQPNEQIAAASSLLPLAASDSVEVSASIGSFVAGQRLIIAQVVYPPDQNPQNDRIRSAIHIGYRSHSVVVNEIMYAPTNTEPEWVELYNTRSDSINIKGWLISDNIVNTRRVLSAAPLFIPPLSFVVLAKDSSALVDVHPGVPSRIVHFPSMPTLNNAGDAVVVYDNRNVTMDSLSYLPSWGGNVGGKSLERIDPVGPSILPSNWATSRHPSRSTPGRKNSVTRKDFDISLDTMFLSPPFPLRNDSVIVTGRVRNAGMEPAVSFVVRLYDDINGDSIPQTQELLSSSVHTEILPPLDATLVSFPSFHPTRTEHLLIAVASMSADEDTLNNMSFVRVLVGIPRHSVVINEIMYSPVAEPEWVELYNTTAESVDVKGWALSNRDGTTHYGVATMPIFMQPLGYAVVTKDTALFLQQHSHIDGLLVQVPTLPTFLFNNSGDAVVLYDGRNVTMDSMGYLPGWGGSSSGRSLERVNATDSSTVQWNWGSSRHPDHSTPGRRNSITRKDFDITLDTLFVAPPFPLIGDSIIVSARIRNIGLQPTSSFDVRLYDDVNADSVPQWQELVSSVTRTNELGPLDSAIISFPLFWPTGHEHHFIGAVALPYDEDTLNNIGQKWVRIGARRNSIVINEIMYSPVAEPEWVELRNTSSDSIDVKAWQLSNRNSSTRYTITSTSLSIPPNGYSVITKDTALLAQRYGRLPGMILQVQSLPTFLFNNSGDAVVVFDDRGQQMDSLRYTPSWGGSTGFSLERIDQFDASDDSANWVSSTDSMRATPGRENSVAVLEHDLRLMKGLGIIVPPGTPVTLSVTVKNVGRLASTAFEVAFYDDRNRDSIGTSEELVTRVHVAQSLSQAETLRVFAPWQSPPAGSHVVIAQAEYPADLRPGNNTALLDVRIGYAPRSVVVNEVMFAPFTNESEYVEIVNAGTGPVDLTGWKLTDRPTATGAVNEFLLSPLGLMLQPGQLFVIASDSSINSRFKHLDTLQRGLLSVIGQSGLGLSNEGDAVILRDITGAVIDSVAYVPSWHHPSVTDATGRSLEKISPGLGSTDARSWSTCVLGIGGTPGLVNSIFTSVLPMQTRVSCSPNPFSPDGDGNEDFSVIHCELPTEVATISLRIYDVKGRLIRYLANNESSGARRDIVWDGFDNEHRKARVGIYVVLVEGLNESGGNVYSAKGAVVLAARLR